MGAPLVFPGLALDDRSELGDRGDQDDPVARAATDDLFDALDRDDAQDPHSLALWDTDVSAGARGLVELDLAGDGHSDGLFDAKVGPGWLAARSVRRYSSTGSTTTNPTRNSSLGGVGTTVRMSIRTSPPTRISLPVVAGRSSTISPGSSPSGVLSVYL